MNTPQHYEDRYVTQVGGHRPVSPGPISIAPTEADDFVMAVRAGGGQVAPLDAHTRGLVWLSERRASELDEILESHPDIEWVQLPWAGVDAFAELFQRQATRPIDKRPVFTSAKGAYSEPVAEHALALLLACFREIPQKARRAAWAERTGLSLYGRRIIVIGAGGVGLAIVDLLAPFRCEVTVVRRDASAVVPGASRTVTPDDWRDLLPETDAVILAAAHTRATEAMVSDAELRALPSHAVVINIARGPLVDTDALVRALNSGEIAGAGLDVTDPEPLPDGHPLFDIPQCVITSHSADTPEMTRPLLAARVQHNTEAFLAGADLRGVVSVEAGY